METPKIFASEYRSCLLLWEHEPVNSTRLAALCKEELGWSKATTYTVIRRLSERGPSETLVVGGLSIHLPSLSVLLDGRKLNLTRKETELLYTLAASPGRVFTRDNLLTLVWGYEHVGNYRAVDSHIKRLRQKLDIYPHDFFSIATVWGTGYKFERKLP